MIEGDIARLRRAIAASSEIKEGLQQILASSGGVPLTDECLAELAAEAERGYDVEKLRARPTVDDLLRFHAVERWLIEHRDSCLDVEGCPETNGRTGSWYLLDELLEEYRERFMFGKDGQ